jgi:hypothetical protein
VRWLRDSPLSGILDCLPGHGAFWGRREIWAGSFEWIRQPVHAVACNSASFGWAKVATIGSR